ncbi:hypothetical protein HDU83_008328, partial [Entophlyctis luteolus]
MGLDFIIAGGGMAGMLLSLGLKRAGHNPAVYERADFAKALATAGEMPEFGEIGGGIGLSTNGSGVLKDFGLWEDTLKAGGNKFSCHFNRIDGQRIAEVKDYEAKNEAVFILRSAMHRVITMAAMKEGVKMFVCKQLVGFEQAPDRVTGKLKVTAQFADGTTATGDVLVGADGVRSTTRALLFDPVEYDDKPIFTGSHGFVGVTHLPPGDPLLSKAAAGASFFTDAYTQKTVEVMLAAPSAFAFRVSDYSLESEQVELWAPVSDLPREAPRLAALSREWGCPDYVSEIIEKANRITPVSIYDRKSLATWTKGHVTLIGDAAHGMPPYLGQGTNQAFEDVSVLSEVFRRFPDNPEFCFKIYEAIRIKRTTQIAISSRRLGATQTPKNFIERFIGDLGLKAFVFLTNHGGVDFKWNAKAE